MGASNTHGGIALKLETNQSFVGQEISGLIQILVKKPLERSTLYLRFCGKEKTAWTEHRQEGSSTQNNSSHHRAIHHKGKVKIRDFSKAIFNWNNLLPGQYSLPFTFVLPNNIPSSFHFNLGHAFADIVYRLQAVIIDIKNRKIKGKTYILIKNPALRFNSNIFMEKLARMNCCCVSKGNCKINVRIPQDTYCPAQVANFIVEINNTNSRVSVNGITCRLFYYLRIKNNGLGVHFITNELLRDTVNVNIPPGSNMVENPITVPLRLPAIKQQLFQMLTTKGALIECVYTCEISADMDTSCMCFGDSPTVISNIIIVPNLINLPPPPVIPSASVPFESNPVPSVPLEEAEFEYVPPDYVPPEAPPDWRPEVLNRVSVSCDPSHENLEPSDHRHQ